MPSKPGYETLSQAIDYPHRSSGLHVASLSLTQFCLLCSRPPDGLLIASTLPIPISTWEHTARLRK
jgi:hypothetical protein